MNLATWSIRNPIPTTLLFVLLAFAGLWAFRNLPIQNIPDIDLPTVNIALLEPGAAPGQLETEVARRVEDSVATLGGLKHIRTSITDGRVSITAQFVLEKPISEALIQTKDAVDRVRSDLPADLLQPTVGAVTIGGDAVAVYAIASDRMDEEALSWFVDDTVAKAVLGVPGVGRIERVGGVQREVRIEVNPTELAALGVVPGDVSRALRQVEQESSGGKGQLGQSEQAVRTIATVRQASDLAALPIALADGRQIRLDQVAVVRDGIADRSKAALLNGAPAVGFKVFRARNFDETRIVDGVKAALDRLKAAEPSLSYRRVSGSVAYTVEQYDGSMHMLYEGGVLAIVVVFFFLREWRATLIAATALPLSILPAFAAMFWLGYSLNILTLLALAVVVGILVDDAIVEIENIERHSRSGRPIAQAVADAVEEIALAVTATTMSLVVVFLPTTFMSGVPGLFFKQFGLTAVVAVLASLLVARLLTPLMAARWLHARKVEERGDGRLMRAYLSAVRWCLDHRKTTAVGTVAFFLGSIALAPLLPSGLIPPSDAGFTTVNIELPPGSSLDSTLRAAEEAREAIKDVPGIAGILTTVGDIQRGSGGSEGDTQQAGDVRRGALIVTLAPRDERARQVVLENTLRERLAGVPGAHFHIGAGRPGEKMELILASDNAQALKASAEALQHQMLSLPGLSNVSTTASLERPEIIVRPDFRRAAERGITSASIGEVVRIATSGDFDAQVARLNLDGRQIYLRVRIADAARRDIETLANLRVAGRDGAVPLSSIASLSVESGPSQIDRYDRHRYVTVDADLGGTPLGAALNAALDLPAARGLPGSVRLIQSGDAETAAELAAGFGIAVVVAVLSLFCVLALLFQDFLQPVTILSVLPLSFGGAFVALLLARSELDLPAMIGVVMLIGIVSKNSILLVEYAVVSMRDHGLSPRDAVLAACRNRARAIVMTTFAMTAGMLPLALGYGADSSFRQPMAVAAIGGLLSSTALSLLVVPVVFTYVDGFERRLSRLWHREPAPAYGTAEPL
ncbi:efflux RND transporter permease subunit [Bradyrhizobium sp.]|uniref:efflux RND transporter permease subunit n=1 Tax=Bradyrhizobium sp. TaxID=376 RepID=UPI002D3AAF76|nr:efflux RND transporter permease subunit [Bradyrhizobium sp.]HZR72643.1 efflux RND transporter permease subunit [Bradyrhizobium sp.]